MQPEQNSQQFNCLVWWDQLIKSRNLVAYTETIKSGKLRAAKKNSTIEYKFFRRNREMGGGIGRDGFG